MEQPLAKPLGLLISFCPCYQLETISAYLVPGHTLRHAPSPFLSQSVNSPIISLMYSVVSAPCEWLDVQCEMYSVLSHTIISHIANFWMYEANFKELFGQFLAIFWQRWTVIDW